MKRVVRNITVSNEFPFNTDIYFTPDEVRQLLLQIDEMKNCNIALKHSVDGTVEFIIGNSVYCISNRNEE